MISTSRTWLFLMLFGIVMAHAEPEPMARPTRPKIFTNPDELRQFLNDVMHFYNVNGRARYGKRRDLSLPSDLDRTWDMFRVLLSAYGQLLDQQQNDEVHRQKDIQMHNPERSYHPSSMNVRLTSLSDLLSKIRKDTQ